MNFSGAAASRPLAGTAGHIYKATDQPYWYFDNGSSWQAYYQDLAVTPPPICASWTQVNWSGATNTCTSTANGALQFTTVGSGSCCQNGLLIQASPSTPYSFTMTFSAAPAYAYGSILPGIALYNSSSGKIVAFTFYGGNIRIEQWAGPTSDNTTIYGPVAAYGGLGSYFYINSVSLKIVNDGTHRTYLIALAGGPFQQLYQETSGTYFTEDSVGIVNLAFNSTTVTTNVFGWTQGTN